MNTLPRPRPLVVVILDGWGISFLREGNAIAAAATPAMDMFARHYPTAALSASGIEVGLPWGEVGNSETGHRNIGAGQVQYQVLPLIDKAIDDGSFFRHPIFLDMAAHVKKNRSNVHLMGLVSPGGVHSHMNHLFALLQFAASQQLGDRVFIHMFTDGRDSPPQSALTYLQQLEEAIGASGVGRIVSVTGRLYAMDRNQNWERTEATYNLLTGGPRQYGATTPEQAIRQAYQQNVFDEQIPPTAITRGGGPIASIQDNDAVFFFNFRPDRARQLTQAFVRPDFNAFPTRKLQNIFFAAMAEYDPDLKVPACYHESTADFPLARIISEAGLKQFHIAETEKYAHITYYLNVGREQPYPNEEHVLIRSASTKNFAEQPHMAAGDITNRLVAELKGGQYDCYFVNYANADMVGHTGNFEATVVACAFVDQCLTHLFEATLAAGGAMIVTADHGNAEEKIHPQTHEIETDHTSNPVPFHYITPALRRLTPRSDEELASMYASPIGVLADVAPTILDILQLSKPLSMTGISLLNSLQ